MIDDWYQPVSSSLAIKVHTFLDVMAIIFDQLQLLRGLIATHPHRYS